MNVPWLLQPWLEMLVLYVSGRTGNQQSLSGSLFDWLQRYDRSQWCMVGDDGCFCHILDGYLAGRKAGPVLVGYEVGICCNFISTLLFLSAAQTANLFDF